MRKRDIRSFPPDRYHRAVAIAAHPDDETLGVSGLLQRLHQQGTEVTLVVATDGENAFPTASPDARRELGRTRRRELQDSLRAQHITIEPHWLGLPDSALAEHGDELAERLRPLLADADACLFPWPGDPHPDHQAAGRAALSAAPMTTQCWSYPVWLWHWVRTDDPTVPWAHAFGYELSEEQRHRKANGIAAFVSQLEPGPAGEDPILSPAMLEHFQRKTEVVFREPPARSAPQSRFKDLYRATPDPWGGTTRWYERRKRAVALAALPREQYGSTIEPACGIGTLTAELAKRSDRLAAFDPVPAAVAQATRAVTGLSGVDIRVGALPTDLPAGPVDLIVFSEILYYLADIDLAATINGAASALRAGGDLLAVHWLPWAPEAPRDGMAAHRQLLDHPGWRPVVEHIDEEFILHVLRRR